MRPSRGFFHSAGEWLFCGERGHAPNQWQRTRHSPSRGYGSSNGFEWAALRFDNDAGDVVIYAKFIDDWESTTLTSLAAEDFRKMAIWYLWRWAWGEGFGLRRRLFYWRLGREVARFMPPKTRRE